MRELTKRAVETFYQEELKQQLEEVFNALMLQMKELPADSYAQYARNALKNLIQLSAKGVTDLNVLITEYLSNADVLYANYEETLQKIKNLDEIALSKKCEQDLHDEEYLQKYQEYERLRKEYDEEKGLVEQRDESKALVRGKEFVQKEGHDEPSDE